MFIPFSKTENPPLALLISFYLISIYSTHLEDVLCTPPVISSWDYPPQLVGLLVQRGLSYNSYTSGNGIFHTVLYTLASFLNKDN